MYKYFTASSIPGKHYLKAIMKITIALLIIDQTGGVV